MPISISDLFLCLNLSLCVLELSYGSSVIRQDLQIPAGWPQCRGFSWKLWHEFFWRSSSPPSCLPAAIQNIRLLSFKWYGAKIDDFDVWKNMWYVRYIQWKFGLWSKDLDILVLQILSGIITNQIIFKLELRPKPPPEKEFCLWRFVLISIETTNQHIAFSLLSSSWSCATVFVENQPN